MPVLLSMPLLRTAVVVLLGARPLECDWLDPGPPGGRVFQGVESASQASEHLLSEYVQTHGGAMAFPIEDPDTGRRWLGEVLPERSVDEAGGRACQVFWARRADAAGAGAADVVEVCFRLTRDEGGWGLSDPRFSRLLPR